MRLQSYGNFLAGVATSLIIIGCSAAPRLDVAPTHQQARSFYERGAADSQADTVIVFVHGVFGDARVTWTNRETGAYFPRLVANDPTFASTDIWVHDFPSPKLGHSYTLDELADQLRRHLSHDNVLDNHHNVIFVAHSMGGLIVRAFLLKYRDLLPPERVSMLFFYSTPTTGSDIANTVSLISKNPQLQDLKKMRTGESGVLATYNAQWRSSAFRAVPAFCAYETLPTLGTLVVQRESAENLCNQPPDPLDKDHLSIVKPEDENDESFVALRSAYRTRFRSAGAQSLRFDFPREKPAWNLRVNAPLLRLSTTPAAPQCITCWSPTVVIEPGQSLYVAIHYENLGGVTARDAWLRLRVPRDLQGGPTILAMLGASNGDPLYGAACLQPARGPVALIPDASLWYPNGADKPLPLPFGQSLATLIERERLDLGDVSPGLAFGSDIVLRFRAVPITIAVSRDVESWIEKVGKTFETKFENAGSIDVLTSVQMVCSGAVPFVPGVLDLDDDLSPRSWVSPLANLRLGEVMFVYVFGYNITATRLREGVLHFSRKRVEDGSQKLSISLVSAQTKYVLAETTVSFSDGADAFEIDGALRVPTLVTADVTPADLANMKIRLDAMERWAVPTDGNRIFLGDLDVDETFAVMAVFEVR